MAEHTPDIPPVHGPSGSLAPGYFDELYAARPDPWDFATSPYEAAKYAATLGALPRATYGRAMELGCANGVFTRLLAPRCRALLATDVAAAALAQARARCAEFTHITWEQRDLATGLPAGSFDLIVLSEVGYYFSLPDLARLRAQLAGALSPGGHLVLVHYTGGTNYPLTADTVHDTFLAWEPSSWALRESSRTEQYRLDLLEATGAGAPALTNL